MVVRHQQHFVVVVTKHLVDVRVNVVIIAVRLGCILSITNTYVWYSSTTIIITITTVRSNLAKGRIADLSCLTMENAFIHHMRWGRHIHQRQQMNNVECTRVGTVQQAGIMYPSIVPIPMIGSRPHLMQGSFSRFSQLTHVSNT